MGVTLGRIHQGDCISGMAALEENSVDLAFADPPFNIGYTYDVYNDRRAADDYLEWSRRWIGAVKRVLKPNGTFWLAIGDEFAAELKVLCTRELGFICRNWVVWFYTFGVHCTHKFTRSHAHLFYFIKSDKDFTFNSDAIRVPSARQLVYGDKRAVEDGRVPDDTWMMAPVLPPDVPTRDGFVLRPQDIPERFPPTSDTWYFSRVAGTFKERQGFHGCQMPEQLLGRIIRACSNEQDLVLDPFAGSGTTLAVAKKLGRRFIGFELSAEYARKVESRLAAIRRGDELDGPSDPALSAPKTHQSRDTKRSRSSGHCVSPMVARINRSLAQIAVANGELATAVAEAFMAAHQGYSVDRVLADPTLNDEFTRNCQTLRIPGGPKTWNHLLLTVRKRGALSGIDTPRRTTIARRAMESFMFASEIAWRSLSDKFRCSLDEILCDPDLAPQFDKLAARIAPGQSPFEYRWAALSLRKDASRGKSLLQQLDARLLKRIPLASWEKLPESPAHYLVTVDGTPFFVGFASVLRHCRLFEQERLEDALKTVGKSITNMRDIGIQIPRFNEHKLQGQWKEARRAKLVKQYEPVGNILLPAA